VPSGTHIAPQLSGLQPQHHYLDDELKLKGPRWPMTCKSARITADTRQPIDLSCTPSVLEIQVVLASSSVFTKNVVARPRTRLWTPLPLARRTSLAAHCVHEPCPQGSIRGLLTSTATNDCCLRSTRRTI